MKTCCDFATLFIAFIALLLTSGTMQAQTTSACGKAVKQTTCTKTASDEAADVIQKVFANITGKANCDPAACAKICAKKPNCKPADCAKICGKSANAAPQKTKATLVSNKAEKPACSEKAMKSCAGKKAKTVMASNE